MKLSKKLLFVTVLASFMLGGTSCEKQDGMGMYGTLGKLHTPTSQGGTHFMGDTSKVGTTYATYTTFVSYNSNINLDDYVGDTISIHGNFIGQKDNGNIPNLLEVVSIQTF